MISLIWLLLAPPAALPVLDDTCASWPSRDATSAFISSSSVVEELLEEADAPPPPPPPPPAGREPEVEVEGVEPDEAPPVAPLDDVPPVAPPVEEGVPVDAPLVADDAPVLPAFETDDPLAPKAVSVAVAAVADWICMEGLGWLETVHFGLGARSQSPGSAPLPPYLLNNGRLNGFLSRFFNVSVSRSGAGQLLMPRRCAAEPPWTALLANAWSDSTHEAAVQFAVVNVACSAEVAMRGD